MIHRYVTLPSAPRFTASLRTAGNVPLRSASLPAAAPRRRRPASQRKDRHRNPPHRRQRLATSRFAPPRGATPRRHRIAPRRVAPHRSPTPRRRRCALQRVASLRPHRIIPLRRLISGGAVSRNFTPDTGRTDK
jgi:hypothetical protein